jgi:hypothetical protein
VRPEVDVRRIEIADPRIRPSLQQGNPMIVGAYVHAPLVAAQIEHRIPDAALIDVGLAGRVDRLVDVHPLVLEAARDTHAQTLHTPGRRTLVRIACARSVVNGS